MHEAIRPRGLLGRCFKSRQDDGKREERASGTMTRGAQRYKLQGVGVEGELQRRHDT